MKRGEIRRAKHHLFFFFIFLCVLSLRHVCVLCVAIQACVWHRKGWDGNAVIQTWHRHGSETPATVLGCGETPLSPPESPATTTNTQPYVGLSRCRPVPGCWRQPQRYRQSEGIRRKGRVWISRKHQLQSKPHQNMMLEKKKSANTGYHSICVF